MSPRRGLTWQATALPCTDIPISQPGDAHEREADAWAHSFVASLYAGFSAPARNTPTPAIQPPWTTSPAPRIARRAADEEPRLTWRPIERPAVVYKDHQDPRNAELLAVRAEPRLDAPVRARLCFNDRLFVSRLDPVTRWCHVVVGSIAGYVSEVFFLNRISPPDPLARLHKIAAGETPLSLAGKLYGHLIRPGHDARYFIGVLAYANGRGRDPARGIYHRDGKHVMSWGDSDWENTGTRAGYYIWVPSDGMARTLESSLADGSLTNGLYTRAKAAAEAVWDFATCGAAFIAGVLHGALTSLWDALTGVVDLAKMLASLFEGIITGAILGDAEALWHALQDVSVDDVKSLVLAGLGRLDAAWNAQNPLSRWHFRGKVIGYIAAEIAMLVFTGGAATGAKWLGKLGKLGKLLEQSAAVRALVTRAQQAADRGGELVARGKQALSARRASKAARRALHEQLGDKRAGKLVKELGEDQAKRLLDDLGGELLAELAEHLDGKVIQELAGKLGKSGLQKIGGQALKKLMADGFNADEVARWAATVGARRIRELAGRYNADAVRHYGAEFFARYRGATDDTIEHVATFEGIKKGEIKGTHDADTFAALFDGPTSYGEVLARTPHPANPLIEKIEYKLYKQGKDGTVDIPPTLSSGEARTKTVIKGLVSDIDYWKRAADEAAGAAINAKTMPGDGGLFEAVVDGLKIRGYLRDGSIDTFFVVL